MQDILSLTDSLSGSTCVYPSTDHWWMNHTCDITADWAEKYQVAIDCGGPRPLGKSYKVMFVSEPAQIDMLLPQLREHFGQRFHIVASEPDRIEMHQAFATKAFGLEQMAQKLGIAQEQVWAVGDGLNDVEMLEWAGQGFAMGQSCDAVKAAADNVLPSIHEHGLCGLKQFIALSTH